MLDIVELERRISAALDRIGSGLEQLDQQNASPAAAPEPPPPAAATPLTTPSEAASLAVSLAKERAAAEQLREALRGSADREAMIHAQYETRIERLTRQLDVQGIELQRMRKTAVTLREELRRLREAQTAGVVEAGQINRAVLAELEALRADRLSELAELDELSAALDEHLTEVEHA